MSNQKIEVRGFMRGRQKRTVLARKRIVLILERGTEPHELERCLNDSRKLLIAAGAKADNLPKGLTQQASFVEGLSPKAEAVICTWFQKNADLAACGDPDAAAERLFTEPDCTESAVWRTVLKAFLLKELTPSVALWLSGEEHPSQQISPDAEKPVDVVDSGLLLSIAEGKEPTKDQGAIPMLLAGAIAAAKGNRKAAEAWIGKLRSQDDPAGPTLANAVEAVLRQSAPTLEPRKALPLAAGMAVDVDHLPFLGVVKRVLSTGQIFVSLTALMVDGVFYEVPSTIARELFPETGDATAFPSILHKQYLEGEIGLWTAVRRGPEHHQTRCVVDKCLPRPFLPVRVPFSSTDPDAVRTWMLHSYTPSPLHQPLFFLSDGLALRLPSGQYDPHRVDFDMPLDGYRDIKCTELPGLGISFVAELPACVEKLDCAPPSTLVKRLFKKMKESQAAPTLTKAEVQALSDLADTNHSALTSQLNRALTGLQAAANAKALIQEAEAELLAVPAVQEIIDQERRRVAEVQTAQLQQAQESLNYAAKRKQALEQELEQLRNSIRQETDERKKAAKQQEADLIRKLRSAFERATQEGAETLAQSAVIRALLQPGGANEHTEKSVHVPASAKISAASTEPPPIPVTMVESVRALRRTIEACASFAGLNELLLAYTVAAARSSPVIGITGGSTRTVIQALADVLAGGLQFRASVSQDMFNTGDLMRSPAIAQQGDRTWAVTVGDGIASAAAAGVPAVIELRGANRAPLEALLPELFDCGPGSPGVSWLDGAGVLRHAGADHPIIWILSFADGKTVFPIPEGLTASTPVLSTDGWTSEPRQIDPPFVATAMSLKCWTELASANSRTQPGIAGPVTKLQAVAQALGVENSSAAAMERLALSVGRRDHAETVRVAKEEGGALAVYAEGLEACSNTLQKLFGIDGV